MEKNKLTKIRDTIEKMSTIHHIKFFEIIKKYNIDYSENRNGIFINMNSFNEDIINELNKYILYIDQQEKQFILFGGQPLRLLPVAKLLAVIVIGIQANVHLTYFILGVGKGSGAAEDGLDTRLELVH